MTDAAQLLYLLGWLLVAAALAFWPRKQRGGELNSDAVIYHVVWKNRKSRKVTP